MTHNAVERNRRKQMNEHLQVLRSLMPGSYVQRTRVHHALNPDQYRGIFGSDSDGPKYARDVDELRAYGTFGRVACLIGEAIHAINLTFNRGFKEEEIGLFK